MTDLINIAIDAANERLQSQGIKIKIAKRGGKVYLRGYFPPKFEEGSFTRQDLSLGIDASVVGVQLAESEALKINAHLKMGIFTWENYVNTLIRSHNQIKLTQAWIEEFEDFYFSTRKKTDASLLTWKKDYLSTFRKLPLDKPLTPQTIELAVRSTSPDSRVRQRCCVCLSALAKFAGIDVNLSPYMGNYSYKSVKERNIPDDESIIAAITQISDPAWRWCCGMIATYGLRNHELFRVDFDLLHRQYEIIAVKSGKTGSRKVCPIHPHWVDDFNLFDVNLPNVDISNSNDSLGHTVSQAFRRLKLPFKPYDLRHAWAIRSLMVGLDVTMASQMMGHSLKVHYQTYHHWISDRHYQEALEKIKSRDKI